MQEVTEYLSNTSIAGKIAGSPVLNMYQPPADPMLH